MNVQTVNNLPPAAADDAIVRCLLAIELSKKSWIVAVNTPLSEKISRYTLKGCDWKGLLELIEKIRTRVARELNRPVEIISCYEAGYDGFWLHRLLEAHGVRNHVIDPASVQVDRRARRAKTDNIDVAQLLRSLMAYLRGDPKVWSVVRVPSVAEEDDRRLHRERDRLITDVSSMSTASRDYAQSTASMTTSPFGRTGCYAWSNCGPATGVNCRHTSRLRSYANCSAWN
jgi:transposase